MDDFLKMDVFFVVATVMTLIVGCLIAYGIYIVVRILRNVEKISKTVSEEADLIRSDIDDMRGKIKEEGFKWSHLARFARSRAESFMGFTNTHKK